VYPKNTNSITFKFNSEKVHNHEFNIGALISQVVKKFTGIFSNFNIFKLSAPPAAATTEGPELDFSIEAMEEGVSISSGSDVKSSEETDNSSEENNSSEEVSNVGGEDQSSNKDDKKTTTSVSVETHHVAYLPPNSSTPDTNIYTLPFE
jgi:hypothetical protein